MLEGFDEGEAEELQQKVIPITKVLVKLCKVTFKTINLSTLLLLQWYAILAEHNKKETIMTRDKKVINIFTSNNTDNGLQEFALNRAEWKMAEQLHEVLSILKDATVFFSCSTPNLVMVIPSMDYINSKFEKMIANVELDPAIHTTMSLAKMTLNKYYAKTSDVY
ncbi:hypothetical protein VKT23_019540 [Stygiomarasmius scandens]|uniref:hAT-like transposase RNase-H fold domain-containing protein n=1 Tax=Marasmiellus scandens TaxID=2682957 RepID=A0ABR1ILG0_9AGAR